MSVELIAAGAGGGLFGFVLVEVIALVGSVSGLERRVKALEDRAARQASLPPPGAGSRAMAADQLRRELRGQSTGHWFGRW